MTVARRGTGFNLTTSSGTQTAVPTTRTTSPPFVGSTTTSPSTKTAIASTLSPHLYVVVSSEYHRAARTLPRSTLLTLTSQTLTLQTIAPGHNSCRVAEGRDRRDPDKGTTPLQTQIGLPVPA